MKKIYVVIEQGAGIIHLGFESEKDADDYVDQLKKETGWDCYEVLKLNLQTTKLVTIQELVDRGELPE